MRCDRRYWDISDLDENSDDTANYSSDDESMFTHSIFSQCTYEFSGNFVLSMKFTFVESVSFQLQCTQLYAESTFVEQECNMRIFSDNSSSGHIGTSLDLLFIFKGQEHPRTLYLFTLLFSSTMYKKHLVPSRVSCVAFRQMAVMPKLVWRRLLLNDQILSFRTNLYFNIHSKMLKDINKLWIKQRC